MTTSDGPERSALEQLQDHLAERRWTTRLAGSAEPVLYVANPKAPKLNDTVVCCDGIFRWGWGSKIGPDTDIPGAANRIQSVLRTVSE